MNAGVGPSVVVGAGPAGSLLAIYLARQGRDVVVYEARPDLRSTDIDAGRSINLALATRGIVPLIDVGVIERVDEITIPMRGRMVHAVGDPEPALQPYGSQPHEVIHSVSRTDLNAILLDGAEATGRVRLEFNRQVESVDLESSRLNFADGSTEPFGLVFGADGAGSRVRKAMAKVGACEFGTEWLDHDYKELELPAGPGGSHQIEPHALHIWPRGEFMLIALANPEGDFTVTLFAPKASFESLRTETDVEAFFDSEFPDFVGYVPDLETQFFENPTGALGTVRATGWHYQDRAVLVGDAAHAVVPFHGQGMNAAMESVRKLHQHMVAEPRDLAAAFAAYGASRKPDADAIADMALSNYVEMRAGVVDPDYLAKRELALALERRHPDHLRPRYNMVMFSTMDYSEAMSRAETQAGLIESALADPSLDIDAMVRQLPPLPETDPLEDPTALSVE